MNIFNYILRFLKIFELILIVGQTITLTNFSMYQDILTLSTANANGYDGHKSIPMLSRDFYRFIVFQAIRKFQETHNRIEFLTLSLTLTTSLALTLSLTLAVIISDGRRETSKYFSSLKRFFAYIFVARRSLAYHHAHSCEWKAEFLEAISFDVDSRCKPLLAWR